MICFDSLDPENEKLVKCPHCHFYFHATCQSRWILHDKKCVVCHTTDLSSQPIKEERSENEKVSEHQELSEI